MLAKIKATLASTARWINGWFEKAMLTPRVNSRFVFLAHNAITGMCIPILVIAFIRAKDRTGYSDMILALGGTHAASALGRFFTKKEAATPPANSDDDKG